MYFCLYMIFAFSVNIYLDFEIQIYQFRFENPNLSKSGPVDYLKTGFLVVHTHFSNKHLRYQQKNTRYENIL